MVPDRTPSFISLKPWIKLTKTVLCVPIGLSSGFGYILYTKQAGLPLASVFFAVFFLALGSATLNSLQERDLDALFKRTSTRPLVTGALSVRSALITSLILLAAAFILLFGISPSVWPLILALLGPVIYNGLYTPLKHVSGFSLLVGGVAGALPPLIGWSAGGGPLLDHRAVVLALLFFLWQVPHYFVVLLNHRQDYKEAGVYNLTLSLSEAALRRVTLAWVYAMAICGLTLSALPSFLTTGSRFINLAAISLIIGVYSTTLLFGRDSSYRTLFHLLNSIFFLDMVLISFAEILLNL